MARLTRLEDHVGGRREIVEIAAGTTVADAARQAFPALDAEDLVAILNGEILSPECWSGTTIGDSDILVICPRAGGPAVAVLAATAVSSFASAVISSAIITSLGLAAASTGAALVTAGVSAVVGGLTMLVARSLVPPPSIETPDFRTSRYWALNDVRNRRRPYGPVPLVLGRMRVWPDLAAVPLTRPQQNRQDLTTILCWGEGPLELDEASLRTGDTPLSDVGEVQHEYAQGWPGEPPPAFRLYGSDVDVQQVGAQLSESGAPTDWVTRTSGTDAETIELVFHFPQGLQSIGRKTGDIFGRTATFEIAHRPVGATEWVTHQIAWSANTTSPISRTWRRHVTGQSEVRVRRLAFTGQSLPRGELAVWAELRTIRGSLPIGRGGLALSALHIEASQRASGSLDAVNGVVTSIVPDWSGSAWNMRPSRNPASLCRWLLTGPHNREPVDPAELDDQAWIDWWAECDSRGWTCDLVVDWDASLVEVLRLVAACGHAQVTFSGGLWTPVVDLPRTAVSMFTPRNARISFERDLTERPHGLRVRFVDAAQDWRPSEVTVYADGYDANTAERFEELELPGVTDALQAFRQARKRLAEMEVRRDGYIVRTGIEHLICRVGDRVEIAHDVRESTAGYGRVQSVVTDGSGNVTQITIDTPVPRDPAQSYDATIRRPGGIDTWMLGSGGSDTDLVPSAPIPAAQAPAEGDLVTIGLRTQVTESAIVLRIAPDGDGSATLECVRYDESIYGAYSETGGGTSAPALPVTAPPTVLSAHVLAEGGALVARVSLLHPAAPSDATGVIVAWRRSAESDWQSQLLPRDAEQTTIGPLVSDDSYEVRARYDSPSNSDWSTTLAFSTATPTQERPPPEVFDLQDWIQSRIDRGESRIELVTAPGARLSVDGLVAIRQYDPYRHVTIDLSRASIDAGKDFRLSARGKPLELPRENQFLLEQDALAGATTARIRTSPQNGDHSLIQIGRRLIIRGQNDARGNTLENQRHICRITSKTVISTYVVEVGIDPELPADFLTEYPNSEWVEDSGGPDRTHIAVLSEIMLAQDAAEGDIIVRTNADPATLGFRAGEIVMVEDDRVVKDIAGGSSTNPVRRELNRVVALGADSIRLAFPLARDFLTGWNARVTRLAPTWNLNVICPQDLRITEAQPPGPYQRQPTFELRFAVGCRLVEPRQDDEANGVGRRGQLVRAEAAFACEIVRPWRRGLATDFSDAEGGDRYGVYGVACRFVRVVDGYFERCRHGVVWTASTDCSSQGSRYVDCLINGWDTHGADSVRCFSVGEEFHAGPSRAPGSTKQSAVTFGNTYHLAGDRDCGVVNGTFIGFTDDDGAVEVRTPCAGIVVSGISYGCRYAMSLRQAGSQDGGSVLMPSFQQLQTPAGGALINDLSGSPKFAPVVLGEVWSDAGEDRYWPSGSSNFAPAARQNFALHRQFITHTDPAAELKIPYSRGQFVEVRLEADVPSVTITSENRARDGDLLFLQVLVRQDAVGGHAWPHPANVTWPGGSPPAATATANRATLFQYMSWDKGTSWLGVLVADDLP